MDVSHAHKQATHNKSAPLQPHCYTCAHVHYSSYSPRSILFFIATMTATACSQALPAMGRMIMPTNAWLRPVCFEKSSMAPVRNLRLAQRVARPIRETNQSLHTARRQGPHGKRRDCARLTAAYAEHSATSAVMAASVSSDVGSVSAGASQSSSSLQNMSRCVDSWNTC